MGGAGKEERDEASDQWVLSVGSWWSLSGDEPNRRAQGAAPGEQIGPPWTPGPGGPSRENLKKKRVNRRFPHSHPLEDGHFEAENCLLSHRIWNWVKFALGALGMNTPKYGTFTYQGIVQTETSSNKWDFSFFLFYSIVKFWCENSSKNQEPLSKKRCCEALSSRIVWQNTNASKQGDFPLCLRPRALGKQICCENQSAAVFRQKWLSAEPRLPSLSTSSRIHRVRGRFISRRGCSRPSLWITKKEAEKSHNVLVLKIQNWAWVSAFPVPICRAVLPQSCKPTSGLR